MENDFFPDAVAFAIFMVMMFLLVPAALFGLEDLAVLGVATIFGLMLGVALHEVCKEEK